MNDPGSEPKFPLWRMGDDGSSFGEWEPGGGGSPQSLGGRGSSLRVSGAFPVGRGTPQSEVWKEAV